MPAAIALDPELAAFIQGPGISLHAASRGAGNVPNLSRALGCRVSADFTRVTVFLLASQSGGILGDYRANGQIAVVTTLPSTHRTVQLKGEDAALEPLQEGDHDRIQTSRAGFAKELTTLGYEASLPALLLAGAREDVVAVSFTVSAAFLQTPGPGAGAPIAR